MRVIKFRVFRRGKLIKVDGQNLNFNSNNEAYFEYFDNDGMQQKADLMQFTGLKDINGVDIYEGDIYHQGDKNIIYRVVFKDCCFIGNQIGNNSLAGIGYFQNKIVVIGNIHENPELLSEAAQ